MCRAVQITSDNARLHAAFDTRRSGGERRLARTTRYEIGEKIAVIAVNAHGTRLLREAALQAPEAAPRNRLAGAHRVIVAADAFFGGSATGGASAARPFARDDRGVIGIAAILTIGGAEARVAPLASATTGMPVVLQEEDYEAWLDEASREDELAEIVARGEDAGLEALQ